MDLGYYPSNVIGWRPKSAQDSAIRRIHMDKFISATPLILFIKLDE